MKKKYILIALIAIFSCNQPEPEPCGEINFYVDIIKPDEGTQETKVTYKDGEKYSGRCAVYYEDGELSSINEYKNGKDHGYWEFYYPNGNIETKGKFKNGERVGKWNYYYDNGSLKQVSSYKRDLKHGVWKIYSEQGELITSQRWLNGVPVN